jgi:hypothetical protein
VTAPARSSTDRPSAQLDQRRDKASAAADAAEKAQAGVTELDHRLQTNASLTTQQSQALRNALAEAERLKRSLKVAGKERERLTKARKKAVDRAERAKAKARAADDKYSKSVLADLVRREKEKDAGRASAGRPPKPATGSAQADSQAVPDAKPAVPDPAPEQPNPAVASAIRTAARKTAAAAGTRARTPRTRKTT